MLSLAEKRGDYEWEAAVRANLQGCLAHILISLLALAPVPYHQYCFYVSCAHFSLSMWSDVRNDHR